ncbi:MAG: hypothetical protein ACREQQ_04800 [Candidatus Binatia bacterium]
MRLRRLLLGAAFLIATASGSYAMSDGNYDPADMGCKPEGNAYDPVDREADPEHNPHAEPDYCQALRIGAGTDANPKFVRVGLDHEEPGPGGFAGGHNPHHGTAYIGSPGEEILQVHYGTGVTQPIPADVLFFGPGEDGELADDHTQPELEIEQQNPDNAEHIDQNPPKELHVFFGADDNLESGEHDGVPETGCAEGSTDPSCDPPPDNRDLANGPSDGGEIRLDVAPNQDDPAANLDPENPDNVAPNTYAGVGMCVDGICANAGSGERQVYDGGQDGRVYLDDATAEDYKDTEDYCSYDNQDNCVRTVHDEQQDFYSRPGVNLYADPDPQDSSLGPFDGSTNTHVGTGGVKVFGVSVIDAQNPTGIGAQMHAADAASPCCAAKPCDPAPDGGCLNPNGGKACIEDIQEGIEDAFEDQTPRIAGCTAVDEGNCIGGGFGLDGDLPAGCTSVGGMMQANGLPTDAEGCTAAAVDACCAEGACH